jgi:uncharacterized membrane protein SpoIIM required for sporulation
VTIEQFLNERRPDWDQLERLLDEAEGDALKSLGHDRIRELVALYRQACSDLNQARSMTANPDILDRLNQLTGRAYRFIYSERGTGSPAASIWRFLLQTIPAAFQKEIKYVGVAGGALLLGTILGFLAVITNPSNGEVLIPEQFYHSSPRERVEQIERNPERISNMSEALAFGSFLFTHNITCSFLAFVLAASTILLGVVYLFWTGMFLGAIAGMYYIDGVEVFFLAWVGPHGSLEIPAIVFAGAAGLRVGRALLLPGSITREASIRDALPSFWAMMIGTALILVVAGLIEGSVSQFSSKTISYSAKIAGAVVLFLALHGFLFIRRVR